MPLMFSKERCGDAAEALRKALKLVQPTGKDVLDLCCGPGRWAIPFARDGFRVTGVDRTKRFLDRARADAKRAGVRIEWVRQDMRDFVRPAAFDLADDLLRPGIARPSGASRIRRRAALRLLRRNGLRPERPALDRGGTEAGVNALPSGGAPNLLAGPVRDAGPVRSQKARATCGDGATPPMVAFWASTDNLNQCISHSRDRGRTWTKYPKNPVLVHPYRDPKVFWYEPGKKWVMILYGPSDEPLPRTVAYRFNGESNDAHDLGRVDLGKWQACVLRVFGDGKVIATDQAGRRGELFGLRLVIDVPRSRADQVVVTRISDLRTRSSHWSAAQTRWL